MTSGSQDTGLFLEEGGKPGSLEQASLNLEGLGQLLLLYPERSSDLVLVLT